MLKKLVPDFLWNYRYFIFTSVLADFKNRVARSRLGFFWLVIAPLSQVLIYAFVLSSLMQAKLPGIDSGYSYSIYLLSGFLFWFLFVEIFTRSLTVFIENASVIKKISFPRLALPIVVVLSALINNLVFFVIVLAVYFLIGFEVGMTIFWLPVIVLLNVMFSCGLGVVCGVLNVFIRDVGQLSGVVIQFMFWLTPIVYTVDILPAMYQKVIQLNPLYLIVRMYHDVIVYGRHPDFSNMAYIFILSSLLVFLGFFLFRKSSSEMVDVL